MNKLTQILQQAGLSVNKIYENGDSVTVTVNYLEDFSEAQKAEISAAVGVWRSDLVCKLWTPAKKYYHLACFVIAKAAK